MSLIGRLALTIGLLALAFLAVLALLGSGILGRHWGPEPVVERPRSATSVRARVERQNRDARALGAHTDKQILFGDLHVHTTYSPDAFMMAMPAAGGDGARPISDACDFARYCSALDFWSVNDHALAIDERAWSESIDSIRQCNAVAGDPANPDLVSFLGWEWTQMGTRPENHYGHKNVIVRGLADDEVPRRPIAAAMPPDATDRDADANLGVLTLGFAPLIHPARETLDFTRYMRKLGRPACPEGRPVRELPADCSEQAMTPVELFAKLDDWGFDSLVIPHGTTWGFYTPGGSSWDKQLRGPLHDPQRQTLIEVFSGHGNSEEFRTFANVELLPDGTRRCPEEVRSDFLPGCQRAGRIVRERCLAAGETAAVCERRALVARQDYVDGDLAGHLTVPGTGPDEWLDAGQCRDCFQPSFNYRPKGSAQYIMALRNFDETGEDGRPRRFRFGFMASSDNHTARPGTGYKEYARTEMTEARLTEAMLRMWGGREEAAPAAESVSFEDLRGDAQFHTLREAERASSFFLTGGLVAAHAEGRDRDAVWEALERREVYGTSGPRILLWFDLLNAPKARGRRIPMGGEARMASAPLFQVRALGSFEQKPGCPREVGGTLPDWQLHHLCRGECYHPSDVRRPITRIEVVRIRPQMRPDEPVETLIEDPWRRFDCDGDPAGCSVTFSDPDYPGSGRDALYYVRAIEAPSPAVNAALLRCETDADGQCVRVRACRSFDPDDDCLAETEERAWSSPIYLTP